MDMQVQDMQPGDIAINVAEYIQIVIARQMCIYVYKVNIIYDL